MLTQTRYRVDGMDCGACASKVGNAVRRVPGVEDVSVSVATGNMTVSHDEAALLEPLILRQVNGLGGYRATPLTGLGTPPTGDHGHAHGHDHGASDSPWYRSRKGLLTIASGAALAAAYGIGKAIPSIAEYAFVAATLIGLVPVARRAVMAALAGSPFSIEMLMTIAAVGAVIIGAGEEGAAVVFLFLIGELLEGVAAGKARASIRGLTALVPKTAMVEENGQPREVPADSVAVGAIIMVRPGDRIAGDGKIVEGSSEINEAPVTGESVPKRKSKGDAVFAGTINVDGVLRVRVTAAATNNTIARLVRLVEEAKESKAPTERFIDRFSTYYTPAVVAVAALSAVIPPLLMGQPWGEWIYKGLAILLIGCPCALVISTPRWRRPCRPGRGVACSLRVARCSKPLER
jgi:Cd2+/Zn2+-exporting ATPase